MCDTIVALGNSTADGVALFAKNSDREPNEGQYLEFIPRTRHAPGEMVRCTYLEVPQVEETYAVLLSRPFWMWGCEMGLNEHGLVIGNEALFTKEPQAKTGLLGMDMMRLALERATTARQALETVIGLLERYGQGGAAGYRHKTYYHNSFLFLDPRDAWVLETAGRYWAARQVRDVYTISNGLTIDTEWDMASPGLVEHAVQRGWCRSAGDFSFARCYSDRLYTYFSQCRIRQQRSTELAQFGKLTVPVLVTTLRDHCPGEEDPNWTPASGSMGQICMHGGFGPFRPSQSTASLVVRLDPRLLTCFATATSAPCTGIFKPLFFEAGLPEMDVKPAGRYDPDSLFWQHERLHRAVLADYQSRLALYRAERDALEAGFLREAEGLFAQYTHAAPEERKPPLAAFTAECFARASERTREWIERVEKAPRGRPLPLLYRLAWQGYNREAGMPGQEEGR
jgi:dipeptidase